MRTSIWYRLAARIVVAVAALFPLGLIAAQADAPAIAQLRAGKVDELQRQFSQVQAAYRQGTIDDEQLVREFRVFYVTEPALEPRFSLWIHKHPDSYVAYLARGIYYKYGGREKRGNKFVKDTTEAQVRGMQWKFEDAMQDLSKSMKLDDKPLLSYLHALDIAMHLGDGAGTRAMLDAATRIDPKNTIVPRKYLTSLETRWGGGPQPMRDFAIECRRRGLPEAVVRDFLGQAELDAGWLQHREQRLAEAEASFRAAVPLLADPATAWKRLGFVLTDERKYQEAVGSLSKALETYPNDAETLSRRGGTYMALKQPALGIADYQRAAKLGDAYAQNALGKHYWHGTNVAKDPHQAIVWFAEAANQGDADGKKNLAWALSQTPGASP
jgi:tetratricopeptide (TPR) repeat protein